ncbi:DUF421 domain-containing protein [Oscillospiraceae bacterium PP1C4]
MNNIIYDIGSTAFHSIISVFVLFILTRLMGKKQISQLSFFDYVVGISIGSIAAEYAIDPSINHYRGITGLIVYALFPITLSYISLKSYKGRKMLDGMPSILIQNGKIIERSLVKAKMNVNDLLEECRLKNAFDISEVEYAILETSGKVSFQLKAPNQPLTPKDMNLPTSYKGLCTNLIIDGKILDEHILIVQKDRTWLINELKKQNISNPNDVLLAYIDSTDTLKCHLKHNDPPQNPIL